MSATEKLLAATAPMLANVYDRAKACTTPGYFPRAIQPKLDGVRLLATMHADGRLELVSRTGKPLAHQDSFLRDDMAKVPVGVTLDGELYACGIGFQTILSLVKNTRIDESLRDRLEYHVYDVVTPEGHSFAARERFIAALFSSCPNFRKLRKVNTVVANGVEEVDAALVAAIDEGYEGVMIRSMTAPYEHGKRSSGLLKLKRFVDAEFEIVGVEEAGGRDAGTAVFVCITKDGKRFRVRPTGTRAERSRMLVGASGLMGKGLTVKFQELTDDGVPRFPVGVAVRDYE
jgi:DNA ligase-1